MIAFVIKELEGLHCAGLGLDTILKSIIILSMLWDRVKAGWAQI